EECIAARLVDFELAETLASDSPEFVTNTVKELYRERGVPVNAHTSEFITNLDMHLLDQSALLLDHVRRAVAEQRSVLDMVAIEIPFTGISIEVGKAWRYIWDRL